MIKTVPPVKKQEEFGSLLQLLKSAVEIDQIMPHQVFNKQFGNFVFEQFYLAMSSEFWESVIQKLAIASGDTHVLVAVLDPDPVSYFYHEFGYYNWHKFPVNITGKEYWKTLETGPVDYPVDAVFFNSETVVWLPMSTKWAMWGERSRETVILAFADEQTRVAVIDVLRNSIDPTSPWERVQEALKYFLAPAFRDQIPKEFSDMMIANYSTKEHS